MRWPAVWLPVVIGCASTPPLHSAAPAVRTRIDDALLENALIAILSDQPSADVARALDRQLRRSPEQEQRLIVRMMLRLQKPRGETARVAGMEIATAFRTLYPHDECIRAVVETEILSPGNDALADTLVACFPNSARAFAFRGDACMRTPSPIEARDTKVASCMRDFAKCAALDPTSVPCREGYAATHAELLTPYCTTADLFAGLHVSLPHDTAVLDVADFAYAVQHRDATLLFLSARGQSHPLVGHGLEVKVRSGMASAYATSLPMPSILVHASLDDVCDASHTRQLSDLTH